MFYNDDKKCNAIEIFNYPNVIVTINNKSLFKDSYENVEKYLKKLDNNLIYESCGILSEKFGINIYAPFLKENPNEEIDAILIFDKYYFSTNI